MINNKDELFDKIFADLRKIYKAGMYEFMHEYEPNMYKKLRELEEEADNAFLYKSIEDLKEVLRRYWTLHMEAIKGFNNQDNLDLKVSEVKEQIQQELHSV